MAVRRRKPSKPEFPLGCQQKESVARPRSDVSCFRSNTSTTHRVFFMTSWNVETSSGLGMRKVHDSVQEKHLSAFGSKICNGLLQPSGLN